MTEQLDPDLAHEERLAAVSRAITELFPGEYVEGWVLITHRRTTELEQQGLSVVGTNVPPTQNWVLTRGMFEIAADGNVNGGRDEPEGEDD